MRIHHKQITGTDLHCAELVLGGANIGSRLDEEQSFRFMDLYVEYGGNMIDTAAVYANWVPDIERSISEKTIGRWMKARGNRSRLIVATKGAHMEVNSSVMRVSAPEITFDLEESLQRLQVDTIDLYWLHRDDPAVPVEELADVLNKHIQAGKIRYIGCSNWKPERIRQFQDYASANGLQGFSANQPLWNMAAMDPSKSGDQTLAVMDEAMLDFHYTSGMPAIPYTSQAQGLFAKLGKLAGEADPLADKAIPPMYKLPANLVRHQRAEEIAAKHGATVNQIALAYLLSHPFPVFPIIGCHNAEQLEDSAGASGLRLSAEELAYLQGAASHAEARQ